MLVLPGWVLCYELGIWSYDVCCFLVVGTLSRFVGWVFPYLVALLQYDRLWMRTMILASQSLGFIRFGIQTKAGTRSGIMIETLGFNSK